MVIMLSVNGEEDHIRYPASQTAERHATILACASRLLREEGLSGVSVSAIMRAAGLTHGPFYDHFASKRVLVSDSLAHASAQAIEELQGFEGSARGRASFVDYYLSTAHRDDRGRGCIVAALGAEATRDPAARRVVADHVRLLLDHLERQFPWERDPPREAIVALAAMVGALVMARVVDDDTLSQAILRHVRDSLAATR